MDTSLMVDEEAKALIEQIQSQVEVLGYQDLSDLAVKFYKDSQEARYNCWLIVYTMSEHKLWHKDNGGGFYTLDDWLGDMDANGCGFCKSQTFYGKVEITKWVLSNGNSLATAIRAAAGYEGAIEALKRNATDTKKVGRGTTAEFEIEPTGAIPEYQSDPVGYVDELVSMSHGDVALTHVLQGAGRGGVHVSFLEKTFDRPNEKDIGKVALVGEMVYKKADEQTPFAFWLLVDKDTPPDAIEGLAEKLKRKWRW